MVNYWCGIIRRAPMSSPKNKRSATRRIPSSLIAALVVLGSCWVGPAADCISAQTHQPPSELVQQLQSLQSTDDAREELLKTGRSDPGVRQYLAVHLPPLIESGPNIANCPGSPCRVWRNAIELAANLKIVEATPSLVQWITVKDVNPWPGIGIYGGKLQTNPAAIALSRIGDPAIPALQSILNSDSGDPAQRALVVRTLCTIHTSKAKAVLRDDLPRESDPDLQRIIRRVLEEKGR